ncbi:hypothetical protein [Neobacillus sp. OS1-33]|uniref:hypothetical protein n=1 Tax=Neobacillus sp. OS1-33 TaxID=3070683 RepID=UPI0027E0C3B1|nr:hypothetical protein [Neobacillus sp. OS1-33]WML24123.1 hypothetical protein RCG22_14270 [Neobacillus sp. OS1-33]
MKNCIFCKKSGEGMICRHCLAKGGAKTGQIAKAIGKYGGMVAFLAVAGKKFRK